VEYAGPDTAPVLPSAPPIAPSPPPAPPAPGPRVARLHVQTGQSELSLQRLQGSANIPVWTGHTVATAQVDQFGILCNLPCDIEVPEGAYQLGVAQGVGVAARAGNPMTLRGDMSLHAAYNDHSLTRGIGWLVFGIGGLGGGGLMVGAVMVSDESASMPMIIGGGVIMTVGMLVGILLAQIADTATISVDPSGVRF
jgi:hypothetical protein